MQDVCVIFMSIGIMNGLDLRIRRYKLRMVFAQFVHIMKELLQVVASTNMNIVRYFWPICFVLFGGRMTYT